MIITETCKRVHENIKKKVATILHCHGVGGSGKSEIVRKMAESFPFAEGNESKFCIKWHIQCKDSGHNLQQELKLLAAKLLENSPKVSQEIHQEIVDNLDSFQAKHLVDILVELDVPILIIVEDPSNEDGEKLLKSLCESLMSYSKKIIDKKIHLYISSRQGESIVTAQETFLSYYALFHVQGFNEQEATKYMLAEKTGEETSEDEETAVAKIFKLFDGLPLGLQVAKKYCQKVKINYSDYVELMSDLLDNAITSEKSEVIKEYGNKALNVFHALVMPFIPNDEEDATAVLFWNILCCISYFHYDRIPRFALEQCCLILQAEKVKKTRIKNRIDTSRLISKLVDQGMCTETDQDQITFHEVVLYAFRLSRNALSITNCYHLQKAVEIMSSLVSKDMRKQDHAKRMYQLRRHLQSLLLHIEKNLQILEDSEDVLLLKALTSHLHETAAAIMLNESSLFWKEADEHYEKALNHIWPEKSYSYSALMQWQEYGREKKEFAQKILEFSKTKADKLPVNFTLKYASKLEFSFEASEIKFLESRSLSKSIFAKVKDLLNKRSPNEDVLSHLIHCGLFLSDQQYKPIFYAERFAFILHSWSRLVLYGDEDQVSKVSEKCLFMSTLSKRISMECRKFNRISFLSEHLSEIGGWVPMLLKLKRPSEELKEALTTCKSALMDKSTKDMFENGMLKEVYGPEDIGNRISLLRYIVRINARLHQEASIEELKQADSDCEELFKLAEKHAPNVSACLMCLIYCAKYYAAKGEFEHAMECFQKYFDLEPVYMPRFNSRCWAVFNYAKAVVENKHSSLDDKFHSARKCSEVLNSNNVMNKTLKIGLKSFLKQLKLRPESDF